MRMYIPRRAYRNSYRSNFSSNSTRAARDQASFTVQVDANKENFYSEGLNSWVAFRMSPAFSAIANMFEQVSL